MGSGQFHRRREIEHLVMAELETPRETNRGGHASGGHRQCSGNADVRCDLSPQDAAERHSAHEDDDKCGESARAHPRR